MHDKNFYKIREAVNHPGNEDVFIDSKDYSIDLTSYVGKWWFAFEGTISHVNASAWVQTGLDAEEIKMAKPTKATKNTELATAKENLLKGKHIDGINNHTFTLSSQNKHEINAAKSVKELETLVLKIREEQHPERFDKAIKKIVQHFTKKSAESKVAHDKDKKLVNGKNIDDILGKEWRQREKSFPISTVKKQTEFDTAVKTLTDKIDTEFKKGAGNT